MTDAQLAANRQNALRSTGPRTAEGKAAVTRNALRHGLTAELVVLPTEDALAFAEFAEDLRESLRPVGAMEDLLAERLVAAAWRLRRALAIEQGIMRAEADKKMSDPGLPFWRDAQKGDALGKLRRYVIAAENSFSSSLHELQRLQATRAGEHVPLPAAVDVNLTGELGGKLEGPSGAGDPT